MLETSEKQKKEIATAVKRLARGRGTTRDALAVDDDRNDLT
jgi:hypothetical protein